MHRPVAGAVLWTVLLLSAPAGLRAGEHQLARGWSTCEVEKVIDGDTLDCRGIGRIRLQWYDSPEAGQTCPAISDKDLRGIGLVPQWRCGQAATHRLQQLTDGGLVTCRMAGREDRYHRPLADLCYTAHGVDIAADMLQAGLAWLSEHEASRRPARYDARQAAAEHAGLGIWIVPAARTAHSYRHNAWTEAILEHPDGRVIKGNITRRGECVYHTPFSRYYRQTRIDPSRGERYFATIAEAVAAGCREVRA